MRIKKQIETHLQKLKECQLCPQMVGPVVTHHAVLSKIYLLGQAPGPHEGKFGKPFAWTAGKTLFRWFSTIGIDEHQFRNLTYMAAVCRCFPGKSISGAIEYLQKLRLPLVQVGSNKNLKSYNLNWLFP